RIDVVGELHLLGVAIDEVAQDLRAERELHLLLRQRAAVRGEEIALHRVAIVRVPVLRVEEPGLEIEPVVEFDRALEPAAGGGAELDALRQYGSELRLDGGPAPLGIVVPT